ncbi:unnamed protein product [Cylindrotheca closterium]|uniref:PPM-type phosphatase domain-containing protein n=1 Tax=Cylindrotheca closterium TaxID=2856 RepID=A0AAD2G1X4_9STRA|nr:unnamed protein product [Cylindrotheca closterium]
MKMATSATRMANKSAPKMGKLGFKLTNLGSLPAHKSPSWTASSYESTWIRSKSTTTSTFAERLAVKSRTPVLRTSPAGKKNRGSLPLFLKSTSLLAFVAGIIVTRDHVSAESKCDFATENRDEIHPQKELRNKKTLRSAEEDIRRLETDSSRYPHQVSIAALQGERWTMEDTCSVESGGRFVAVFDGHGGSAVSTMLRDHLYRIYRKKLVEIHGADVSGNGAEGIRTPTASSHVQAISEAIQKVEAKVMTREDLVYQGSTAVAVIMHVDKDKKRTILAANVGDSRAVLSRSGKAVPLTRDHKPSDERERARLRAIGVEIEWDPYGQLFRVCDLSLSRAIGDRFAKPAVSSETEISRFPLLGKNDEFVILASDGLWDVMSSQETVDFVHQRLSNLRRHQSVQNHSEERFKVAEQLAKEALERGSADNVCVLILWLSDQSRSSN